jgi:hypothetical protein
VSIPQKDIDIVNVPPNQTTRYTDPRFMFRIMFEDCDGKMLSTHDETWENAGITAEIIDKTEIFTVRRIVRVKVAPIKPV